jgi:hypothetical protein
MASTYSPSLRIELIGAGDQAGTWNTTTNSNLGTIIESAIAGYVAVSVTSANQAFTALDGAADQARNAVIALTTTTGANFAVYAPPQEKTYVIYNTTAYVATVYNSTVLGNTTVAGLGVAVAAGGKVAMFSDGTNFRTTDAGSFSGVLPVVNGGTGVTTSTGTGNTVLSASPTFTGTPTMPTGTIATTQTFGTNNTTIATTAFVQAALQLIYPVGSIYTNASNSTNPATLFGFGTWSLFSLGRVLVGYDGGTFNPVGAIGGNANSVLISHAHTASSSSSVSDPSHVHSFTAVQDITGTRYPGGGVGLGTTSNTAAAVTGISVSTSTTVNSAGSGSGTNENLQPYIVVYMWNRTA